MPDGDVVAMKDAEFQWLASSDPRLAAYAASRLPAWLWTADGRRILWANPAGARLFGAASAAALAEKTFGPADRHRRQIARLAGRLLAGGAIRLERLQGFGAAPGMLATCGCFAVRLSRWQPRRSDRRRQHRADRAATERRRSPITRCSRASHIIRASLVRASLVRAESCSRAACPSSSNRSRRNRLPMTSSRHHRAKRPPGLRCSMRLPNLPPPTSRPRPKPFAARPRARHLPSKRLPASRRRRRAACRCASPGRWIGKAASRSAPTNSQA